MALVLGVNRIDERGQGGAWGRIVYDSFPRLIAIQFRQQGWQITHQLLSFGGRKRPNRRFDFTCRTHVAQATAGRW